jgi:hypothetical protein
MPFKIILYQVLTSQIAWLLLREYHRHITTGCMWLQTPNAIRHSMCYLMMPFLVNLGIMKLATKKEEENNKDNSTGSRSLDQKAAIMKKVSDTMTAAFTKSQTHVSKQNEKIDWNYTLVMS